MKIVRKSGFFCIINKSLYNLTQNTVLMLTNA